MHRPFDGAFAAHYPEERAIRQCTEVLYRLISYPNNSARDRAYTMLYMAEADLHSFDYDSGRWVHAELERTGLDEDAKRTFILNLHPHPSVGKLLLQRCGMSSRWLTHNVLERLGHNPDTYYIIGPDYRIPEPSDEAKAQCIEALQQIGFTTQNVTVQTCGGLRAMRPLVEGQPSTEFPLQTAFVPSNVNSYPRTSRAPCRRWACRLADTIRPNEVAKRMPESTGLAECGATPAWRVPANDVAVTSSSHQFVRTPHLHGC